MQSEVVEVACSFTVDKFCAFIDHVSSTAPQQKDSFGDLLSGMGMSQPPPPQLAQPAAPTEEPLEEIMPGMCVFMSLVQISNSLQIRLKKYMQMTDSLTD